MMIVLNKLGYLLLFILGLTSCVEQNLTEQSNSQISDSDRDHRTEIIVSLLHYENAISGSNSCDGIVYYIDSLQNVTDEKMIVLRDSLISQNINFANLLDILIGKDNVIYENDLSLDIEQPKNELSGQASHYYEFNKLRISDNCKYAAVILFKYTVDNKSIVDGKSNLFFLERIEDEWQIADRVMLFEI